MPNFKVKAIYEYSSPHDDDLNFPIGQIITVTEQEDDDWYVGEYNDESGAKQEGLFPKNFVEKYEPELPARPNRASRHKPLETPAPQPEPPTPEIPQEEPAPAHEEAVAPKPPAPQVEIPATAKAQISPTSPPSATSTRSTEAAQKPPSAPQPAPAAPAAAAAKAKSPPPVAAKSSSFRDRIAAFNQPAAAPVTPFKPGGPPTTFIKKPFVAPPPSRNAYVPPPREAPQVKTYRRDEDPEIAERRAQDQENAEKSGLTTQSGDTPAEGDEEQPKPTSLKERIALLQKQQAEQAQRAAAAHKEKPKKPPMKKRTESHDGEGANLEKIHTADTERGSMDFPRPAVPEALKSPTFSAHREPFSDANDADQSGAGETEDAEGADTSVEEDERPKKSLDQPRAAAAPMQEPDVGDEEGAEEEESEEDEMDEETRRRMELRERMAKMSGGMGMAGMFGPPGGLPMGGLPPKKKKSAPEKKSTGGSETYANPPQQRIPMIPVPGMSAMRSPEPEEPPIVEKEDDIGHPITAQHPAEEVPDVEDVTPQPILQRTRTGERGAPPPPPTQQRAVPPPPMSPTERGAPPPIPSASRPVPPPPPGAIRSPSPGSESGDEMTGSQGELPPRHAAAPTSPKVPQHPSSKRSSYLASDEMSQDSSSTLAERRGPPQIPLASPTSPTVHSRPPPPPPPGAPPSRQHTMDDIARRTGDRSEGETDYEGDYDTDIAPGATHKEALKAHARDSSHDESTIGDDTPAARSPILSGPPPIPSAAPRAVPPPPPQAPPRKSLDAPRNAPPPVPPRDEDEDDYDPYRYNGLPTRAAPPPVPHAAPPPPQNRPPPPMPPPVAPQHEVAESSDEDDLYSNPPPRRSHDRPPPPPPQAPPHQLPPLPRVSSYQAAPPPQPAERAVPLPPTAERPAPPPPPPESAPSNKPMGRKSLDVNRAQHQGRPSMDLNRPPVSDFIASDIDLGQASHWWTQPNMLPPSLQQRKDILTEMDESRNGNDIEKGIYVLYMDYSQTIITATFPANNVSDVQLQQHHDPPPGRLRQDQLEAAHDNFGLRIAKDIESKQNTVVGDGTPQSLIHELLRPYSTALKPISTRSFGALVYANLANASTQQYDEIRPGDIISFRNAKFQGKHGAMHAKYSTEVGKPDHVGVVVDWDGTKKKVRAWEQGRESKKVKVESFKMGDLRSGEVRVWRVMGREWVGWGTGQ